jgi:O-methyltransferase involved in polyketide biosynthesis
MYLPKPDVTQLFQRLAQRFTHSQFAFDMIPEKYLKGLWKMLLRLETKINWVWLKPVENITK